MRQTLPSCQEPSALGQNLVSLNCSTIHIRSCSPACSTKFDSKLKEKLSDQGKLVWHVQCAHCNTVIAHFTFATIQSFKWQGFITATRDPKSCLKSEEHEGAHFYKTDLQWPPLSFTDFKSQMSWQDHKEMTDFSTHTK